MRGACRREPHNKIKIREEIMERAILKYILDEIDKEIDLGLVFENHTGSDGFLQNQHKSHHNETSHPLLG